MKKWEFKWDWEKMMYWQVFTLCVSVIGLDILAHFQYEQCYEQYYNKEGWLLEIIKIIGELYFTGLFYMGFIFLVFISISVLYWIVNDDLKKILDSIPIWITSPSEEKESNPICDICISVVIYVLFYLWAGDYLYGCTT